MTQNSTDLCSVRPEGVTDEQMVKAVGILTAVATSFTLNAPDGPADSFDFLVRVGATAYDLSGTSRNGTRLLAGLVRHMAPEIADGMTRGAYAEALLDVARAHGWSDDEDPNGPAIPKHDIPGPRRSDESGKVPCPRREQSVNR